MSLSSIRSFVVPHNCIIPYFNSEIYIEGVRRDLPLVRLVQKSLFNFGKEKRHDILVNNSREMHVEKKVMGLLLGLLKNPPYPINKKYPSQTNFSVFYFSKKVRLTGALRAIINKLF